MSDLYGLLGVSPRASSAEVTAGYRRALRRYHPDTADPGSTDHDAPVQSPAADTLRSVMDAYAVLHDPRRRAEYDRSLAAARPRPRSMPVTSGDYLLRVGPVSWQEHPAALRPRDMAAQSSVDDVWGLMETLADLFDRRWLHR